MAIKTEVGSEETRGWYIDHRLEGEMILEACVESLEEALLVQTLGAERIELCADLHLDGLTPSFDLIEDVMHRLEIPVRVMIRPRKGDFIYSGEEMDIMLQAIDHCKQVGVDGVVFGVLTAENKLDLERIQELAEHASPLKVTIHKAIDQTPDPVASVRSLINIQNIHSVLTSGGALTAIEGVRVLQKMIQVAGDGIEVIVAGKVVPQNIDHLHQKLNSRAYHGRKIVGELLA